MTLQFDPSAYQRAFEYGQNRDQQGKQMVADSLSAIPKAFEGIAQQKEAEKRQAAQDQMNKALLGLKAGEQGYDPNKFMALGQPTATAPRPNPMQSFFQSKPLTDPTMPDVQPLPPQQSAPPSNLSNMGQGGASGNPFQAPPPQFASAGVSDTGQSPHVAAWNALPPDHPFGASQPTPQPSQPSNGMPQGLFDKAPVDYNAAIEKGPNGILNLPPKAQGGALQLYKDKQEQAKADNNRNTLSAYEQKQIDLKNQELGIQRNNRNFQLGEKGDQFDQKEWDKIAKDGNAATASGRTPLGVAARSNLYVSQALQTLNNPVVTVADAANAINAMGSAFGEAGRVDPSYNTLFSGVQGILQKISGKPTDALPNDIKAHIVQQLQGIERNNKALISKNLDYLEKSQPKIIGKHQDEWQGIRQSLEGATQGAGETQIGRFKVTVH